MKETAVVPRHFIETLLKTARRGQRFLPNILISESRTDPDRRRTNETAVVSRHFYRVEEMIKYALIDVAAIFCLGSFVQTYAERWHDFLTVLLCIVAVLLGRTARLRWDRG